MYLRFVIRRIHPVSHVWAGIFRAAYELREGDALTEYEREQLDELLWWFEAHLPSPTNFRRCGRSVYRRDGVCWFKQEARTHLQQIWAMVSLLESNGVWIHLLKAQRPGYVVYEDDWQIVAVPSLPKRR